MRAAWIPALFMAFAALSGCGRDECNVDSDCSSGFLCRSGLCVIDTGATGDVPGASGDGSVGGADGATLECRAATAADLVLTEILADPGGSDFDNDGDPTNYDSSGDEYVEFVNVAGQAVSLANVEILVAGKNPVRVAVRCLQPYEAYVHWGRDGTLGLTNTSGTVTLLVDALAAQAHTYGSEANDDQSITLSVQLDASSGWVKHSEVSDTRWSPGTCANGSAFPYCEGGGGGGGGADAVGGDGMGGATCDGVAPQAGDLVINEILADPGTVVDANGDGAANGDDEFVEVVNVSGLILDISGLSVSESSGTAYTAPAGTCLQANQALVVFSKHEGGAVGGAVTAALGKSWQLNNDGDLVTVRDAAGAALDSLSYAGAEANHDQSAVRWPELSALSLLQRHGDVPGAVGLASPGTCANGHGFPDCEPPPVDDTDLGQLGDSDDGAGDSAGPDEDVPPPCGADALVAAAGLIVLNEILADPPSGVDVNGNGATGSDDEFLELVNVSGKTVDLSGVQVLTGAVGSEGVVHTFTAAGGDICLQAGGGIVLFSGAAGTFSAPDTAVWSSTKALSLNNDKDNVIVRGASGGDIDTWFYGSASDQSWTRSPDATGAWTKHTAAEGSDGAVMSPGTCIDGSAFAFCL